MNTPAKERSYFGIQFDLKRNMQPFSADNIRALPSDNAGVYAIWIVEQLIYGNRLHPKPSAETSVQH